jgi:large subunit ribosomal protein L15
MRLHELKPAPGSRRERKRVGRGISAGQGKTAGRGQKGQFARTPGLRHGFEGGQMPLAQRLPKLRGFHNRFKKDYAVVNVSKLSRFAPGSVVDPQVLREAGLVGNARDGVKVLGAGRLQIKRRRAAPSSSSKPRRKRPRPHASAPPSPRSLPPRNRPTPTTQTPRAPTLKPTPKPTPNSRAQGLST